MPPTEGLWIESGITVFSRLYLQGLWQASEKRGAKLVKEEIKAVSQLADFDQIVLAAGSQVLHFEECRHLPLKTNLGQTLLCRWKTPLPFSLVSQGHITLTEDPDFCQVGSTYEHTPTVDPKKAEELLEKVSLFYPPASQFEILEIRSGARIAPKEGYRPLFERISPNAFVFTGFGSRALLYHALLGKALAKSLEL